MGHLITGTLRLLQISNINSNITCKQLGERRRNQLVSKTATTTIGRKQINEITLQGRRAIGVSSRSNNNKMLLLLSPARIWWRCRRCRPCSTSQLLLYTQQLIAVWRIDAESGIAVKRAPTLQMSSQYNPIHARMNACNAPIYCHPWRIWLAHKESANSAINQCV